MLSTPTAIAVYVTIWWVTLFAILPLGVRSREEAGEVDVAGADPGAPTSPRLLWKAAITTVVSAIAFAALLLVLRLTDAQP